MNRTPARILLMTLALALLPLSCASPTPEDDRGVAPAAAPDRKTAPDFALQDLQGRTVRLSDSAGQVRLVDFWATWCAPCREEIPMFEELQRTYGPKGFTILAISQDDGGADVVRPFLEKEGVGYTNLIGGDEVAQRFGGIFGLPTAFLVDRQGRIVERLFGPKPRWILERKIQTLLEEQG